MRPIAHLAASIACAISLLATQGIAEAQQVIRFLHNETDPPSIAFFRKAIQEFEKQNPGTRVEMEAVSTDGRLQKVMASLSSRTMPSVFKILPEERFQFARKGFLVPLDDEVKAIGRQDFVDGALVPVDGRIYDLPYTLGNFSVTWYRTDLLKAAGVQPPKTWDDARAAAKALTKGDTYGYIFPAGKNRMTSIFLSTLIWSAGGTYFDKDLNVTFNNPATVAALRYLKDMAAYSPKGIASYSYGDMINVYLTGKVAIDIYAPRLLANATSNAPDLAAKTAAVRIPTGPGGAGVKFVNSNSYAVASAAVGNKNVEGGRKFLTFLVTGERLRDFSLTAFPHLIPPLKSVQQAVIDAGTPQIGGRKELAQIAFDTSSSLDFDTEAGATFAKGQVTRSGVVNPYIGAVIARGVPAEVVQRVVLQGEDPAKAAAWGAGEMQRIVGELKGK